MSLSEISIRRPVLAIVMSVVLVLFGIDRFTGSCGRSGSRRRRSGSGAGVDAVAHFAEQVLIHHLTRHRCGHRTTVAGVFGDHRDGLRGQLAGAGASAAAQRRGAGLELPA